MNYYIIGSKYGTHQQHYDDVMPKLLAKGVISTGFHWEEDLSEWVGKEQRLIAQYLKEKSEPKNACYTLKHFLNLKPGDLVAVKVHSSPSRKQARLVIGAYAIVKGDKAPIYKHCEELGHTIEVEFIETGLEYEQPLGYGLTIHHIKGEQRIKQIFGYYSNLSDLKKQETRCYAEFFKNTDDIEVSVTATYIQKRTHDKIQNVLLAQLYEQYGYDKVKPEFRNIDILVELADKFIVYEVKSSVCANRCIRDALGQIMQYGHDLQNAFRKAVEYVVAGPSAVDDTQGSYYSYIKNTLTHPFCYLQVVAPEEP
ncbi:hypothetical protein [Pseudoalteromonas sp. S16_S37]|uniref:hypothetical protein n=1 Tax=Pseudoalteromonas sp. S16_S37 TaxID=2720228 RepID=UPI001680CCC0|nr:hypothetical protein [Pseudoalteromonas sp. S16_S37]MBD1584529.1 hypothetical protein [Pseudoalteromonas sp. S16_S37]